MKYYCKENNCHKKYKSKNKLINHLQKIHHTASGTKAHTPVVELEFGLTVSYDILQEMIIEKKIDELVVLKNHNYRMNKEHKKRMTNLEKLGQRLLINMHKELDMYRQNNSKKYSQPL